MRRIDVSLIAPAFTFVPLFAAKRRGFFERRGVDCVYEYLGSGDAVTDALRTGRIQLAPSTPEGALADRAAGGTLVVLGGLTNRLPFRLIGLPQHTNLEALRGGTIGVSSLTEGTVSVIEAMLAAAGLHQPDDYTLEVVGAHPRRWELLQHGAIDAALQLTPFDRIAIEGGFSDLGDPSDLYPEFAFSVVAADAGWAAANHELTVEILRGLLDATQWLYEDVSGGAQVLVEETGVEHRLAELSLLELVQRAVIPRDLEPSREGLDVVLRIMHDNGRLSDGAPLDPEAYLDLSFLERARRGPGG
jgi:ABC-type nitrate/sulfonate/bicarbonate transport system substrate-binding protein